MKVDIYISIYILFVGLVLLFGIYLHFSYHYYCHYSKILKVLDSKTF